MRKFGAAAKREFDALKHAATSIEGRLAQVGLGVSAVAAGMQSARLDKELKQLQLTAGATAAQADVLRQSWLDAQIATGQGVDELKSGSDALVAAGLSIAEANAAVLPMAETMAVAKTNAVQLGQAMGVAAKNFDIDLSSTKETALLLDKMVVAGRLGNAELENLPDIFARVGGNAKAANLGLDQTLALVETLSAFEPNAERLATLADSTLRVFTNDKYRKDAQKATGVRFFNKDQSQRDAVEVIEDIKSKYDKLTTDLQRNNFIAAAFGAADMDTIKGIRNLLTGNTLDDFAAKLSSIQQAGGTVKRDLPDAINNAVDQTGRLKGALREAADGFAQPINDAISGAIKWGLDSKKNGGLGLDGTDMLLGGAVGAAGLFGAARYGGKAIKGLAGKLGGVATGVATGKALEQAAGVQPVYVVNMSDGGLGGADKLASAASELLSPKTFGKLRTTIGLLGASNLSALPMYGAGAMATAGAAVAGAGAVGYGVGTLINDYLIEGTAVGDAIGKAISIALSPFSEQARANLAANERASEVTGKISIHIDSEGRPKVTQLQSSGVDIGAYTGKTGAGS
ncbi:Phage-related minor tail protein [compost metagenome]